MSSRNETVLNFVDCHKGEKHSEEVQCYFCRFECTVTSGGGPGPLSHTAPVLRHLRPPPQTRSPLSSLCLPQRGSWLKKSFASWRPTGICCVTWWNLFCLSKVTPKRLACEVTFENKDLSYLALGTSLQLITKTSVLLPAVYWLEETKKDYER